MKIYYQSQDIQVSNSRYKEATKKLQYKDTKSKYQNSIFAFYHKVAPKRTKIIWNPNRLGLYHSRGQQWSITLTITEPIAMSNPIFNVQTV